MARVLIVVIALVAAAAAAYFFWFKDTVLTSEFETACRGIYDSTEGIDDREAHNANCACFAENGGDDMDPDQISFFIALANGDFDTAEAIRADLDVTQAAEIAAIVAQAQSACTQS